jgi:hypothetical protein
MYRVSVEPVKSPKSDEIKPENEFIKSGTPHLISRFLKVELGPNQILIEPY